MEIVRKEFGERLKKRRKELGFSREKLADYVNVDPVTIYRLETQSPKQRQNITFELLAKLSEALKLPSAAFFTDDVVRIAPSPEEALEVIAEELKARKSSRFFVIPEEIAGSDSFRDFLAIVRDRPDVLDLALRAVRGITGNGRPNKAKDPRVG